MIIEDWQRDRSLQIGKEKLERKSKINSMKNKLSHLSSEGADFSTYRGFVEIVKCNLRVHKGP